MLQNLEEGKNLNLKEQEELSKVQQLLSNICKADPNIITMQKISQVRPSTAKAAAEPK